MANNSSYTPGTGEALASVDLAIAFTGYPTDIGKVAGGVLYASQTSSDKPAPVTRLNPIPVSITDSIIALPTGASTAANQATELAILATLAGKDFATQATLATLLARITACDTGNAVLSAGERHLGEVGGNSAIVSPALAVTASSAYAAGNVVGGVLTLTGAMRKVGGTGVIQNIHLIDQDNQKPLLDIIFFSQNPSNGTYTNKTAIAWNAGDLAFAIARVSITSADWATIGGVAFTSLPSLGKVVAAVGSADLFAIIVTQSTPTWTGTSKLAARFGFLRD